MANRPEYYPRHDELQTNITLPQDSSFILSGYPKGSPVPSRDHNGKLNSSARWHAYKDEGTLDNEDWTDSTATFALTQSPLAYDTGGNVTTTGAAVISRGVYLFEGVRLQTNDAFLNPIGAAFQGSPLKFPAAITPGRLWVYAQKSGQLRIESVAPATVDAPQAGEMSLVGLDIDALGVVLVGNVSPTTAPLPPYELGIALPLVLGKGPTTPLTINNVAASQVGLVITGPGDAYGLTSTGGAFGAAAFSSTTTSSTIDVVNTGSGRGVFVQSDSATSCAVKIDQQGSNCAAEISNNGSGTTVTIDNLSTGTALAASNTGAPITASFRNFGTGSAVSCNNGDLSSSTFTCTNSSGGPACTINGGVFVANAGAEFNNGAAVNFRDIAKVLGAAGGSLTSDATAAFTWAGIASFTNRCNIATTTSTTAGDLSKDGNDNLEYNDGTKKKVHVSPTGWFKGYGQSNVGVAAATLTLDTTAAVAPIVAADIDVHATAWVQRAAAGDIIVSLIEVGVGQISTSGTITLPAKSGNNFVPINFCRKHTASTTARVYRFFIDGNGSNVNSANSQVVAVPGASS